MVDCREAGEGGVAAAVSARQWGHSNCSGSRAGNLYLQFWLYYADSATLRGVPIAGDEGFHKDDWESVQIRIGPDGKVDERASSHHGYNHVQSVANAGSDAGIVPLRDVAESIGARPANGWGPETRLLVVSGGSHAGNTNGFLRIDRVVPGRRVHLVPLEPIADRGRRRLPLRDQPAVAQAGLARPEAERHRLSRRRASHRLLASQGARRETRRPRAYPALRAFTGPLARQKSNADISHRMRRPR